MSGQLPLGYHYNDGGISNQKFALLGLCVTAVCDSGASERQIYLPKILSRDQNDENSSLCDFESVFWGDVFGSFCGRWGITIVDAPSVIFADRIERGGWAFFDKGTAHLRAFKARRNDINGDIAADFFRSLIPRIRSGPTFQKLCNEIVFSKRINTVAQLRIEDDWFHYCKNVLAPAIPEGEDFYIEAHQIVAKIKNSPCEIGDTIFVVCDERYLLAPKKAIADKTYAETGIRIVWKSDLLPQSEYEALSPLEASLIDFEIAALAPRFVGNSRSTFANLVCFERFVRFFRPPGDCYIYNNAESFVGLRMDLGTTHEPKDICRASGFD